MPLLARIPGCQGLRAVREERVYYTDGNTYFSRPGPRLVDSLEILAHTLHPAAVSGAVRAYGCSILD
jgi:iron complex transport system substrate-binding protein